MLWYQAAGQVGSGTGDPQGAVVGPFPRDGLSIQGTSYCKKCSFLHLFSFDFRVPSHIVVSLEPVHLSVRVDLSEGAGWALLLTLGWASL